MSLIGVIAVVLLVLALLLIAEFMRTFWNGVPEAAEVLERSP